MRGFAMFGDEIDDLIAANDFSDSADPIVVSQLSGPSQASVTGLTNAIPGSPAGGGILGSISGALGTFTRGLLGGSTVSPSSSAAALAAKKAADSTMNTILIVGVVGIAVVGGVLLLRRRA